MQIFGTNIELPEKCPYCNKGPVKTGLVNCARIPVRCDICKKDEELYYSGRKVDGITYHDGGSERSITKGALEDIKSRVVTHEGEYLSGRSAQKYMDKYSKQYLGKDLSGSYKRSEIV